MSLRTYSRIFLIKYHLKMDILKAIKMILELTIIHRLIYFLMTPSCWDADK